VLEVAVDSVGTSPARLRGWGRTVDGAGRTEAEARLGSDAGVQEEAVDARPCEGKAAALGEGGEQGRRRRRLVARRRGARGRGLGIDSSSGARRDAKKACGATGCVRWRD
jgi:hypothetical protein